MLPAQRDSADAMRARLLRGHVRPAEFRAALTSASYDERDAWVDCVFGLDAVPEDGASLPRGGVPYLPCAVDLLLHLVDLAHVEASDVFVDLGSGIGRAAAVIHALTGASTIGIEIQPQLVSAARRLAEQIPTLRPRLSVIEGDAAALAATLTSGTVFFLYCPFSGARLDTLLTHLETIARTRQIRVCCVDLPLPPQTWLARIESPGCNGLELYRSTYEP